MKKVVHDRMSKNKYSKNNIWRRVITWILIIGMVVTMFMSVAIAAFAAESYWPTGIEVSSASAVVMEAETGTVLFEKNADDTHYPASITKIMTGLVAVENSSLDETVVFSEDAVYKNEGNSSHIARDVAEEMTMEECLYGMLLESANECAYAIAEHIGGGDVSVFINMMNARAKELGCTGTHFVNPNGLPDEEHYTTAHDMALIGRAAVNNDILAPIMATKSYTIPPTNKHDEPTLLNNHHAMLNYYKTSKYLYEGCLGGKTGYTVDANNTLVTFAKRDDMTLIAVVMNVDGPYHYVDTTNLFDYCFDNFRMADVTDCDELFAGLSEQSIGTLAENIHFTEVETTGRIILPKTADVKDTTLSVVPAADGSKEGVIGHLVYSYGDHQVGVGDLIFEAPEEEPYPFHNLPAAEGGSEVEYVRVDFKLIFSIVAAVVAGLLILIFLFIQISKLSMRVRRYHVSRKQAKSPFKRIYRRRRRGRRRRMR